MTLDEIVARLSPITGDMARARVDPQRAHEAPRSEVIHDLRWSAIQMAQIEGRCIQSMKAMVGDDVETWREIERLLADARAAEA